jgi:hypothetical protein
MEWKWRGIFVGEEELISFFVRFALQKIVSDTTQFFPFAKGNTE